MYNISNQPSNCRAHVYGGRRLYSPSGREGGCSRKLQGPREQERGLEEALVDYALLLLLGVSSIDKRRQTRRNCHKGRNKVH